ncbi:hypothetical protein JCM11641_001369 [Rhodosporidiobolus odoratus]
MPLKTYWDQVPKLTRRHVRLWERLSQFSITWAFIPGKKNVFADSLSRLAELCADDAWLTIPDAQEPPPAPDDHEPFPTTPSAKMVLAVFALSSATVFSLLPSFPKPLCAPILDKPSSRILAAFPPAFTTSLLNSLASDTLGKKILADPSAYATFHRSDDGFLFRRDGNGWQLFIPAGKFASDKNVAPTLVEAVLEHSHRVLGHLSAVKTLDYLRRAFWWPSVHRAVMDYVKSCETCARAKSATSKPFGLLHPLPVPERPWAEASMDFVVGLPPVLYQGALVDSILSVTDLLSRAVVLIPLSSTASAEQVADLYYDTVYRRYGMQQSIVSDRDPKFTGRFWRALHARLNTSLRFSSSAHPQTDGRSEATNKVIGQILRAVCEDAPEDWAAKLATCEFAINSACSSATGASPFEILFGFLPSSWPTTGWTGLDADLALRGERARLDWLRCTDALIASRVDMVHSANQRRRQDSTTFAVGSKVYVSSSGMRFPHTLSGKFIPKFFGPFTITAADVSKSSYTIAFPPHIRIHPRIHASKLRPFFPNDDHRFPSRSFSSPPPAVHAASADEEENLVEKFVGDRTVRNKREFQVRYLGYSASEDQWRPESELAETAPDILKMYLDLVAARRGSRPAGRRTGASAGRRAKALVSVWTKTAFPSFRRGGCKDLSTPHSFHST